jgi:hypothetical protein
VVSVPDSFTEFTVTFHVSGQWQYPVIGSRYLEDWIRLESID